MIEAEQFEGAAAVAEPAVRFALGGGMQHAGDDEGGRDGGIACGGTGLAEQSGEAELVESIEADGDRAVVGVALGGEAAGAETADEVLGGSEDLVGDSEERGLAAKDIASEVGDVGPEGARDGIVGAEVEEGFLLDRGGRGGREK